MFQFLFVFGPAAITYMTAEKLSGSAPDNWYSALIRLICCAELDTVITTLCLLPFGRVELIMMTNGVKNIQYGGTAFIFSLIVGVLCGLVIAVLKKNAGIRLEAKSRKKETGNE